MRGALEGLWGQEQSPGADFEDWARSALQALAEIGDVVTVGGGYWLATPLRLIELPGADGLLVLGSDPADVVASKPGLRPTAAGSDALSQASLKRSSNHLALVNPVETWSGPSDPLPLWTANIL